MKTFTAPNNREVSEVRTTSGVTGWMDTSIPAEALKGWREHLLQRMASDAYAQHAEDISEIERLSRT